MTVWERLERIKVHGDWSKMNPFLWRLNILYYINKPIHSPDVALVFLSVNSWVGGKIMMQASSASALRCDNWAFQILQSSSTLNAWWKNISTTLTSPVGEIWWILFFLELCITFKKCDFSLDCFPAVCKLENILPPPFIFVSLENIFVWVVTSTFHFQLNA